MSDDGRSPEGTTGDGAARLTGPVDNSTPSPPPPDGGIEPGHKTVRSPWGVRALGIAIPPGIAVLIAALLNPSWLFNTAGYLDPWIYTSLSRTWSDPEAWDWYYKTSRLGWVIPAWIMHPVTGSFWGHALVAGLLVALTGITIGLAVARLVGTIPGALSGLVAAGWGSLQLSGGADYHNQMAGLWLGLSLLALSGAAASNRRQISLGLMVAAGVAFGLSVHASPIMVNLVPFVVIFTLAAFWPAIPSLRKALALGAAWVGGAIAATLALGVASLAVGREFLFFMKGADLAAGLVSDASGQSTWWKQISWRWPVEAENMVAYAWHLPMVLVGGASAIAVVGRWRSRSATSLTPAAILALGIIATGLLFTMWQVLGQTSLQPSYFTYPLGLCAAIGIGIAAAGKGSEVGPGRSLPRLALMAAIGVAFAIPLAAYPVLPTFLASPPTYLNWIAAAALGLAAVALLLWKPRSSVVVVAALLLGASNVVGLARIGFAQYSWSPTGCRGDQGRVFAASVALSDWAASQSGARLATGAYGPILWWPGATRENPVAACGTDAGAINLQNVGQSIAQMGFDSFLGLPVGEPATLDEVPADTLDMIARDEVPIVILSTDADVTPRTERHGRFVVECRERTSWVVDDGYRLNACLAYVRPISGAEANSGPKESGAP